MKPNPKTRLLTQEEMSQIFGCWVKEGIAPFADAIIEICKRGQVPCLVFEPKPEGVVLRTLANGDPTHRVFGLASGVVRAMVEGTDQVTSRWFSRLPFVGEDAWHLKVFLVTSDANFLLNNTPGEGWYIEPGSTDAEMDAMAS